MFDDSVTEFVLYAWDNVSLSRSWLINWLSSLIEQFISNPSTVQLDVSSINTLAIHLLNSSYIAEFTAINELNSIFASSVSLLSAPKLTLLQQRFARTVIPLLFSGQHATSDRLQNLYNTIIYLIRQYIPNLQWSEILSQSYTDISQLSKDEIAHQFQIDTIYMIMCDFLPAFAKVVQENCKLSIDH